MRLLLYYFFSILGLAAPLYAEFIQTSNFFQSADGTSRVIPTSLGIYFLQPANPISVQEFNLNKVTAGIDAFLEYDRTTNRYSALYVGSQKYAVRGSFSLKIDSMIVKVDNFANPYTTIEKSEKGEPSIIALQGVTAVGNYTGRTAVAILSANQVFENLVGVHPYVIESDNRLTLNGKDINTESIGLDIHTPENPCLSDSGNVVFLTGLQMSAIRANKDPIARRKELAEAIKKTKVNVLRDLILLKAATEIIAFDPRDSSIKAIKLVSTEPKICEIKTVNLQ